MGMLVDPYRFGTSASYQTVLLLGYEGTDGATTTSDESPTAKGPATAFLGNAQIDTAQSKFGGSSLLLDGSGDLITFGDSNDWTFDGDFTIEMWVRFSNLTGFQTMVSQWDNGGNDRCWLFDFPGSANNVLRFGWSPDGVTQNFLQGAWTPSANTWYHVAVDRSGSTLRLYANGSSITSGTMSGSTYNAAEGLRIGAIYNNIGETNYFKGWIDELRITKGLARYASDSGYTVPTIAFPRGTAFTPASLFTGGETGDYWKFDVANTDSTGVGVDASTATGLVNGHVMTAPDMTKLPTTGSSGFLDFAAPSDRLIYNFGSTVSQPGTIILCAGSSNNLTSKVLVTGSAAGSRWQISIDSSSNIVMFAGSSLDSTRNQPLGTKVLTCEFNGTTNSRFRVNGESVNTDVTGNAGTQGTNQVTIGALYDGTVGYGFTGYSLIFINRLLTATERDNAERFLGAHAGLSW